MTQKAVAIKVLKEPASPDLIRRFVREARALSAVRHPNVIEVHDVLSLDSGLPALVLDLFEGETLATRLEREGTLPARAVLELMLPVVSALAAIHGAGVVHRDLKPDNIFLARLGDGRVVPVLLDFGVCKLSPGAGTLVESGRPTAAGQMMGTPSYMAPEQVRGEPDVDARADVWALGIVIYECIVGAPPFRGDTMADVVRSVASAPLPRLEMAAPSAPAELSTIVHRMLLRDRSARVSDWNEVREALEAALDGRLRVKPKTALARPGEAETVKRRRPPITLDAPPVSSSLPPSRGTPRGRAVRFGAAAVVSLLAGAAFSLFVTSEPAATAQAKSAEPSIVVTPTVSSAVAPAPSSSALPETEPAAPPKAKAKPTRKLPRPIPNYGGRR
jgi:serine/threonine-protein kinase